MAVKDSLRLFTQSLAGHVRFFGHRKRPPIYGRKDAMSGMRALHDTYSLNKKIALPSN